MRKSMLTTLLLCFLSVLAFGQELQEIRDAAGKNQWDKAKEGIDKHLAVEKNTKKGEGWYLKSVVYNTMARDAKYADKALELRAQAFDAYKKYLELDKDAFEGKLNQHATLFDVAFGHLQKASEEFNAKKFDDALSNFKAAEGVQDYIVKKGFSYGEFAFPAYDTQLYLNVAAAAVNAKKEDLALEYYQKIADKKIVSKGYEEIYRYIVDKYSQKGDKANKEKYMALGKEVYPNDPYWSQIQLDEAGNDKNKLFTIYDKQIADNPTDYSLHYNYAVEMFNYSFTGDKRPDNFADLDTRLPVIIKKTIAINSTPEANMLMTRYVFAHINDLQDSYTAIKGTKPDDIKKKKDLTAQINVRYDEMLPYAMTIYNMYDGKATLKPGEKGHMKLVTSMILEYWERKDDKVKMKTYQDKLKAIDL